MPTETDVQNLVEKVAAYQQAYKAKYGRYAQFLVSNGAWELPEYDIERSSEEQISKSELPTNLSYSVEVHQHQEEDQCGYTIILRSEGQIRQIGSGHGSITQGWRLIPEAIA